MGILSRALCAASFATLVLGATPALAAVHVIDFEIYTPGDVIADQAQYTEIDGVPYPGVLGFGGTIGFDPDSGNGNYLAPSTWRPRFYRNNLGDIEYTPIIISVDVFALQDVWLFPFSGVGPPPEKIFLAGGEWHTLNLNYHLTGANSVEFWGGDVYLDNIV